VRIFFLFFFSFSKEEETRGLGTCYRRKETEAERILHQRASSISLCLQQVCAAYETFCYIYIYIHTYIYTYIHTYNIYMRIYVQHIYAYMLWAHICTTYMLWAPYCICTAFSPWKLTRRREHVIYFGFLVLCRILAVVKFYRYTYTIYY
jgi:hypothetical protein